VLKLELVLTLAMEIRCLLSCVHCAIKFVIMPSSYTPLTSEQYALDLTNQKFGKLTVLAPHFSKRKRSDNRTSWICVCECGTFRVLPHDKLIIGSLKSCGCLFHSKYGDTLRRRQLQQNALSQSDQPPPPKREPDALDFLFAKPPTNPI
jgi:hypothetical protein